MKTHPSHKIRVSVDSSIYDEVCDGCGATDASGDVRLGEPCPAVAGNKPPVKYVEIQMKHDDRTSIMLYGYDGLEIYEHNGYMPRLGVFGGDDTHLKIDNSTGLIVGWKPIQVPMDGDDQ